MADEITTEEFVELALAPANIAVDGQSVSERPLSELIEAKKELAADTAATAGRSFWAGSNRFAKAVTQGGRGQ